MLTKSDLWVKQGKRGIKQNISHRDLKLSLCQLMVVWTISERQKISCAIMFFCFVSWTLRNYAQNWFLRGCLNMYKVMIAKAVVITYVSIKYAAQNSWARYSRARIRRQYTETHTTQIHYVYIRMYTVCICTHTHTHPYTHTYHTLACTHADTHMHTPWYWGKYVLRWRSEFMILLRKRSTLFKNRICTHTRYTQADTVH